MATANDTFSLDGFRRKQELPIAQVEVFNHPEAVEVARARIAELSETYPLESASSVPTQPTEQLITDRQRLQTALSREQTPPSRPVLPSIVQPVITAVGIFLLILIIFKSPVIISQVSYLFHKTPTTASTNAPAASIIPADPTITIPKINVHAPVIYEPSTADAAFQTALESGVVHYGNTAVPGQTGNVAIFGHSSNDWWQPGNYKFVFVLLDKLTPGDQITIDYQSKRYTYEVTGSQVVDPTNVSVLNQTSTPTLSLITCTPPGTSWKRLVVTAKQVDPSPGGDATPAATPAASSTSLTSGQSGFGSQLSRAWHSFTQLFSGHASATPTPTPAAGTGSLPAAN